MRRLFFTIVLSAATLTGCVRLNGDHCGNQDGNVTCQERGGEALYCSVCVSDNNGCVAVEPTPACGEGAATEQAGSTLAETGAEVSTGSGETTVVDPSVSSAGSSDTGEPPDSSAGSSDTGGPPDSCGNSKIDDDEECDGDATFSCADLSPSMYSSGDVSCTGCEFDYSDCDRCTPQSSSCAEANDTCCAGTSCTCLVMLCTCTP